MPKDNIERAIKKGTGVGETEAYEEVVYEGYGPGGAALYVETLTDNKNRTVGELRHTLTRFGGNLGATGCVSYLFEKKGQLSFDRAGLDVDALLEAALESGADDVVESGRFDRGGRDAGWLRAAAAGARGRGLEAGERGHRDGPALDRAHRGRRRGVDAAARGRARGSRRRPGRLRELRHL